MRQRRQGFRLGHAFLQAFEITLRFVVAAQVQHSRLGECPFEMAVADLRALGTVAFAGGFGFTFDQATVGSELLYRVEAVDIADFIKDSQRQDAADAGDGA